MLCRCVAKVHHVPISVFPKTKLQASGFEGAYLGYDSNRDSHWIYVLELNRIMSVIDKEVDACRLPKGPQDAGSCMSVSRKRNSY